MLTWSLLSLAILGLVSSTGFLVLVMIAAVRFRLRAPSPAMDDTQLPPVTLLKPLCGLEPNLEANLASFFDQDYPGFEIIFGTRDGQDPALDIVRSLQRKYPAVPVKIVYSGEPDRPNAKVCSLEKMYARASYEYLVISDSDVEVAPNYIREVVGPLLDPEVGLVSCIYRGLPTGGLWSRLEALGMSVEMTSGVIVADMLAGMTFALGPTMAVRREVLDEIGGMPALADYCADDYVLGHEVHRAGYKVVMPKHVIDHVVMNRSFVTSMLHQLRWTKSTRFSRPAGHLGSVLTYAMPFGVLGGMVALIAGMPMLAVALLGWAVANRMVMSIATGYAVVGDVRALQYCWLYPLRDLMGFAFWCGSYVGDTVDWRGEKYRLVYGGKMLKIGGAEARTPESEAVTVNDLS
jgi:ceramide glucosyltransferase